VVCQMTFVKETSESLCFFFTLYNKVLHSDEFVFYLNFQLMP